jgi:hypothetical protein
MAGRPKRALDLPALIRQQQKTLDRAKQLYDRADGLLAQIVAPFLETCKSCGSVKLKEGAEVALNDDGKVAYLSDNFAGETVVWGHGGCRRYGVKVIKR